MKKKTVVLNSMRDVTLSLWPASEDSKKPCFLICPGGAYRNCDESEGAPIAKAYNKRGYTAFILRYSVGKDSGWPNPLEDFEAAMEYLTAHQEELHICAARVIAVGLSAGGHLVTAAASSAKNRPYAVISCYGLAIRKTLAYCLPDAPDTSELVTTIRQTDIHCFLRSTFYAEVFPVYLTFVFDLTTIILYLNVVGIRIVCILSPAKCTVQIESGVERNRSSNLHTKMTFVNAAHRKVGESGFYVVIVRKNLVLIHKLGIIAG